MEITMMLVVKSLVMFSHGLTHIDPFVPRIDSTLMRHFPFFYVQAVYFRHFEWKWT